MEPDIVITGVWISPDRTGLAIVYNEGNAGIYMLAAEYEECESVDVVPDGWVPLSLPNDA